MTVVIDYNEQWIIPWKPDHTETELVSHWSQRQNTSKLWANSKFI